jgi:2-phospho-L-lactate transferase/gluconeogenesis factor (CofD/UPF0052 family)
MPQNSKVKIALFSGGSGNVRFINLINNLPNVELTILVNGYDDGKSTGEIRKYIPGILGPSDFRKNISHLIDKKKSNGKIFYSIFNYRFAKNVNKKDFKFFLKLDQNSKIVKNLKIHDLSFQKFLIIKNYLDAFNKYYSNHPLLNLSDISLGNILITGSFLKNKKNFNKSLHDVQNLLEIKNKVLNITKGENLFLNALLEDGTLISNEEHLVQIPHKSRVDDIFLLKEKLSNTNIKFINTQTSKNKKNILNKYSIRPKLNEDAANVIRNSDIIIYGPGTQFSSLFPSYITTGLAKLIEKSKAKKFLVTNIYLDNDIIKETVESIIHKFHYFFSKKNPKQNSKLVDFYLVNKFDQDDLNLLKKSNYLVYGKNKNYTLLDWEKGEGLHYPNWLAKKIFSLSNKSFLSRQLGKSVVSIIIPCLNERHNIDKVLKKINNFKLVNFDLVIELIVVDGGSNDGSIEIIKKYKNIKFYSLNNVQKGQALKFGIEKCKGDIVVFFPSDNEYQVEDIERVIAPIMLNQSNIVYGSRMIKCINLDDQLNAIYKNNLLGMLVSKYGGKLINLFILAFFNKSISDPFTTLKAFDSDLLKSLKLRKNGFDMDFEIFVKLNRGKNFFLEVPVNFKPRTGLSEKKMTVREGLKCLFYLIFNKFIK